MSLPCCCGEQTGLTCYSVIETAFTFVPASPSIQDELRRGDTGRKGGEPQALLVDGVGSFYVGVKPDGFAAVQISHPF